MARVSSELYTLADHVCRVCFGRILRAPRPDGHPDAHAHRWVCSNCGTEAVHREPACICACGIRLKSGRDPGVRCQVNPEPTPEFPSLIVAAEVAPETGR